MIEFSCTCGKTYRVKDEMAGKGGTCKQCGAAIRVPEKADNTKAPPQGTKSGQLPWNTGPEKKLAKMEKKCGGDHIYLMGGSRRFFSGGGSAEFRGDVLAIKGSMGPDLLEMAYLLVPALVIGNLLLMILPIPFEILPVLYNALCLILLVARPLLSREDRSIRVKRDRIASVSCKGPVVTIKFSSAPVPGLNAIRMFVAPSVRGRFFNEFDRIFPDILPEDFRTAVQIIRKESALVEN